MERSPDYSRSIDLSLRDLSLRDQKCVWHPFTQAATESPPIPIVKGSGAYLYAATGEKYIDAISSWWVNLHGHAHPYIAEKIKEQADELEHVLFASYTHPEAVILAERLLSLLGNTYSKVFYSDNGSTAVEVALKMALQASQKKRKKARLLSFHNAYHGDTFGAMAAAGKSHYNEPFWPYLFEVHSIPPPSFGKEEESWQEFVKALRSDEIGAFIFEPLIQGAGGMLLHSPFMLSKMIEVCHEKGVITIADEVMTGFGRTGPLFARDHLTSSPDIICLSKGITGGFLPLGATIVKESIFEAFLSEDPKKAFLHGHSYTANPLACAAANASLDLLLRDECSMARAMIEREHRLFQEEISSHPKVARCDALGTIFILQVKTNNSSYYDRVKHKISHHFLKKGIIVRPLGDVLYIIPPYCILREDLKHIYEAIHTLLNEAL